MPPIRRRHRRIGLLVFILLAVSALGGIGAELYANISQKPVSNEQASKEVTTEETTAGTASNEQASRETTIEETTAGTAALPEKTVPAAVAPSGWVSAIGDSVMIGAVDPLLQEVPNLGLLDAQGSRQALAAIEILRRRAAAGQLGESVVVHIGNNGPLTDEQFDEMMRALAGVRKVLIVNLTVPPGVPDPIAAPNNTVLANGVQRYPNAVLVDWHAANAGHPELLEADGTHLTLQGAQAYASLIATYLGEEEGSVAPPGPQERITWGEGGLFGECVGPASWCAAAP